VDALTAPLPAPVPLDLTMGDAETMTLGDLLPDSAALRPHDEAEAQELAAAVRAALAGLPPRERAILAARHGQAVQQAEARALARLRLPALRRWLAANDDDDTPAAS
jgi:DNA-directed RNA polymerase sigma subunit (sigma70/sigma32)